MSDTLRCLGSKQDAKSRAPLKRIVVFFLSESNLIVYQESRPLFLALTKVTSVGVTSGVPPFFIKVHVLFLVHSLFVCCTCEPDTSRFHFFV